MMKKLIFFACWCRIMGINGYDHSGLRTLKLAVYQESMEWTDFWCVDGNLGKPRVTLIIFGWWWSKIGVLGLRTNMLCLKNELMKWVGFLHFDTNSGHYYFWSLSTSNYVDSVPFSSVDSFHMARNRAK